MAAEGREVEVTGKLSLGDPAPDKPMPGRTSWARDFVNAALITAIVLGVWRAVALGADGVAAAGLMLGVAGLLGITVNTFDRLRVSRLALVLAVVFSLGGGCWGQRHFANQPVDVSEQITWTAVLDTSGQPLPDRYQTTSGVRVPKHLNTLHLRIALVNLYPDAPPCLEAHYRARRLGDVEEGARKVSGDPVDIPIPDGVKNIELQVAVDTAGTCKLSVHTESATFENK